MKISRLSFLIASVIVVYSTMVPHLPPIESRAPLTYKVSLNDAPEVRWAPLARDFAEPIKRFM
jgi:hypothetical protein